MFLPYISSPSIRMPVCGLYMNRRLVIWRISMISRLTWITMRDFSTGLFVRSVVLLFCSFICIVFNVRLLFVPFVGSSCRNRLGVLRMRHTAVGGASCGGFSCQLRFRRKEELAGNALQAAVSSATADFCI